MIKRYLEFIKEAESLETISTKKSLEAMKFMVKEYEQNKNKILNIYLNLPLPSENGPTEDDIKKDKAQKLRIFWDEKGDKFKNKLIEMYANACEMRRLIKIEENKLKKTTDQKQITYIKQEISKTNKEAFDEEKKVKDELDRLKKRIQLDSQVIAKHEIEAKSVPATTTP